MILRILTGRRLWFGSELMTIILFLIGAVKKYKNYRNQRNVIGGLMNETDMNIYIIFDALNDNNSGHSLNVIDLNVNG